MSYGKVLALAALGVALLGGTSQGRAQVGISIGVAPSCPYGYFDYEPYQCAPYGYYGPTGLQVGSSLGQGLGSAAMKAFTAMWTTGSIRIMVIAARYQSAESGSSTTSTGTRHGMDGATRGMQAMTQATNMRFLARGAVVPAAADTDARAISETA